MEKLGILDGQNHKPAMSGQINRHLRQPTLPRPRGRPLPRIKPSNPHVGSFEPETMGAQRRLAAEIKLPGLDRETALMLAWIMGNASFWDGEPPGKIYCS